MIKDNQQIINSKYFIFKDKFLNYLEIYKKKFQFNKDLLYRDEEYLRKRFYVIVYNYCSTGYFIKINNMLQQSNSNDLLEYFNLEKQDNWQKYLIETAIELKKVPEIQKFYEAYKSLFTQKLDMMKIDKLVESYSSHFNLGLEINSIQIYLSELYFFNKLTLEKIIGASDVDNYHLSKYSDFYIFNSNFITLSTYLLEIKNLFLFIF